MRQEELHPTFTWQRWRSEEGDLAALPEGVAARMLFDVLLINRFELALLELKGSDAVWGPVHTSVGQEATAAGVVAALRPADKFAATYRSHHQFLAKVLQYELAADWNPAAEELPEAGLEVVRRTMAEIMGLAPGYCGGRGGSMHLRYAQAGFLGANAIVAGGLPLAAGAAYAEKQAGSDSVVVGFVGDGALHQGALHEALNMAGLWKLPLICFVENNGYAVATSVREASAVEDLSVRAAAYDMDGYIVDGSDPVAIYRLVRHVAQGLRGGGRPALIEAKCYRRFHHAGDVPGSAFRYRSRDEEAAYAGREVTRVLPEVVQEAGILSAAEVARIREDSERAVTAAMDACAVKDDGGAWAVRAELWPRAETAADGMRSAGSEWQGITFVSPRDLAANGELTYADAIAAVTGRWLERDPRAIVFGEEVANLGGGAYGATKGLPERFPDRVINTPISEGGFAGLGFGAAQLGMRVVVEIMFADFALVAADQLFNQISKGRHMYGDTTDVPLVIRTRIGTGLGYGAQHSMDPVGLYGLFPGFRIVAPATSADYIGLFNSAMHSLDPVVMLEHNALYTQSFPMPTVPAAPDGGLDYCLPFGQAELVAHGDDLTIVTYGHLVGRCLGLVERLTAAGVSADIVDLKTLDHVDLDYATVGASLARTGALLIVEEAARSHGIAATVAEQVQSRFFDDLDAPVAVLTSLDISTPVSRALELAALVSDDQIADAAVAVGRRTWQ
ncbi:MAG: thiamine pyrophosphate-dependent enzyme [Spirochaetaceae bacterium]|nr:thiamine pyrophosphate-dependent enzyme [Spirochaetaceae bacterium]